MVGAQLRILTAQPRSFVAQPLPILVDAHNCQRISMKHLNRECSQEILSP